MKTILVDIIAGARPNFMKIAPIIRALEAHRSAGGALEYRLIHTGQHYDARMSGDFFEQLGIPAPHINLEVGSGTQAQQTGAINIHPFDDPQVWRGHASLVHEIAEAGIKPGAVVLSVGGGGLLCISYHLLGHWCYRVAAMSWMERKAASSLFGTPPESTYQETLDYFLKVTISPTDLIILQST